MPARKDDPQVMETMRAWLQQASELAQVDGRIIAQLETDLLQMTAHTAHELSRPGTPLTAFIAGVGAAMAVTKEADRQQETGVFSDAQVAQIVDFTRRYVTQVMAIDSVRNGDEDPGLATQ